MRLLLKVVPKVPQDGVSQLRLQCCSLDTLHIGMPVSSIDLAHDGSCLTARMGVYVIVRKDCKYALSADLAMAAAIEEGAEQVK